MGRSRKSTKRWRESVLRLCRSTTRAAAEAVVALKRTTMKPTTSFKPPVAVHTSFDPDLDAGLTWPRIVRYTAQGMILGLTLHKQTYTVNAVRAYRDNQAALRPV